MSAIFFNVIVFHGLVFILLIDCIARNISERYAANKYPAFHESPTFLCCITGSIVISLLLSFCFSLAVHVCKFEFLFGLETIERFCRRAPDFSNIAHGVF